MSPGQEDSLLSKTVKTMMSQICKIAFTYCCELSIEGTIGITIDKQKAIVIHFDDRIAPGSSGGGCVDAGSSNPGHAADNNACSVSLPVLCALQDVDVPRQPCVEALASLQQGYFGGSLPGAWSASGANPSSKSGMWESSSSSKMMSCFRESPANQAALSQTLNETIAIDSDSDSLEGMRLDCMSAAPTPPPFRPPPPHRRHGYGVLAPRRLGQKTPLGRFFRARNSNATKDKEEMFETTGGDMDEEAMNDDEDLKSPRCPSVGAAARRVLPPPVDCESLPDASESRSLFSEMSPPHALYSGEDFDVKSGFEMKTTTTTKPVCTCEICGRHAPTICQLEAHLVSKHDVVESAQLGKITHFRCPVCAKRYRFQAHLDKHMVRHEADRPHKCKDCRNAYRYEESLRLHMRVHRDRLECDLCNKMYMSKVLFQKHITYMHEKTKDCKD